MGHIRQKWTINYKHICEICGITTDEPRLSDWDLTGQCIYWNMLGWRKRCWKHEPCPTCSNYFADAVHTVKHKKIFKYTGTADNPDDTHKREVVVKTVKNHTIHDTLSDDTVACETYEKGHGRLETRCLKASTALNDYLDWPGLAQVIECRYIRKNMCTGKETHKVQYGRTSLDPKEASAERLLTIRRGHWTIENKVHWVRDVVFREDVSPVRCGAIPQVMAAMRNTAMSVLRFSGYTAIAKATHFFASKPKLAVKLIK